MDEKTINKTIRHNLVKAREEAGLTQKNLEEQGVISQTDLSKIENGVKKITASKLFVFAEFYKKPIQDFFKKQTP